MNLICSRPLLLLTLVLYLNKQEKVKKDTSSTQTTSNYQALIHIKTGDYGADYKVKVTVYNDAEMTTVDSSFGTAGVKEATFFYSR